jgi:hypothetical protein
MGSADSGVSSEDVTVGSDSSTALFSGIAVSEVSISGMVSDVAVWSLFADRERGLLGFVDLATRTYLSLTGPNWATLC